jgi:hypothetical protein
MRLAFGNILYDISGNINDFNWDKDTVSWLASSLRTDIVFLITYPSLRLNESSIATTMQDINGTAAKPLPQLLSCFYQNAPMTSILIDFCTRRRRLPM